MTKLKMGNEVLLGTADFLAGIVDQILRGNIIFPELEEPLDRYHFVLDLFRNPEGYSIELPSQEEILVPLGERALLQLPKVQIPETLSLYLAFTTPSSIHRSGLLPDLDLERSLSHGEIIDFSYNVQNLGPGTVKITPRYGLIALTPFTVDPYSNDGISRCEDCSAFSISEVIELKKHPRRKYGAHLSVDRRWRRYTPDKEKVEAQRGVFRLKMGRPYLLVCRSNGKDSDISPQKIGWLYSAIDEWGEDRKINRSVHKRPELRLWFSREVAPGYRGPITCLCVPYKDTGIEIGDPVAFQRVFRGGISSLYGGKWGTQISGVSPEYRGRKLVITQ